MRKTFQLQVEGKHPDRLLEAIKHEIRKYIKRERRRELPEGSDFWDFDTRFGTAKESAEVVEFSAITSLIDGVAKAGGPQFYIELLAKPAQRPPRPPGAERKADTADAGESGGAADAE